MTTTSFQAALGRTNERLRRALGMSRPLPRVTADLRTPVPAWVLRGVQLVLVFACIAVAAPNALGWLVAVLLGGLMVALPRPFWSAMFVVLSGVTIGLGSAEPFPPSTFALLFGLHLLVALSTTLDRIPLTARVELAVLAVQARRFLVVQGFSQALALLAVWVTARDVAAVWVAVVAGALVAVVLWVIVARLSRAADEADDLA